MLRGDCRQKEFRKAWGGETYSVCRHHKQLIVMQESRQGGAEGSNQVEVGGMAMSLDFIK